MEEFQPSMSPKAALDYCPRAELQNMLNLHFRAKLLDCQD